MRIKEITKEKIKRIISLLKEAEYSQLETELYELSDLLIQEKEHFLKAEDLDQILQNMTRNTEEFRNQLINLINFIDKRLEEHKGYNEKRFEMIDKRFEDMNKRFEEQISNSDKRFNDMNKRFEEMNKRFEDMNKRFEEQRELMDKRFEDQMKNIDKRFMEVHQRFHDLNKRIGFIQWMITFLFSVMMGILSFFYYQHYSLTKEILNELRKPNQKIENLKNDHQQMNVNFQKGILEGLWV
ncbi:MAG: hypothetical protein NZ853_03505 [Leptospiraceae bacterium]|nr:hypothetical protein [Leptospiraceae bacterium]MDW7975240.1 hypothetical protein [Leptospiraceae bacterium]